VLLHDLALGDASSTDDDSQPALVTADETWSRIRLRQEVDCLTVPMATLVAPGARIAIASDSRPEVVALLLAIPAAGRVAVPINTRLVPDEVGRQLEAAEVGALVGTEEELRRLASVTGPLTTVGLDPGAGDISLDTLVAARTTADTPRPDGDDPAWIVFTSGTTGRPRGVVLTARSLSAAVAATAAARPLAEDEVYLYPFPLYHVSAYNVLHALARRRPVVLPRRFDVAAICALADEHRVTAMSLAPTMLAMLLDHRSRADDPATVLATLRTVAYGAAPMPLALLAEADAALHVGFAQGYGMTELSGNAVFLPPEDHRRGLAGDVARADADSVALAADIRSRAGQHLAGYKVPKRVELVDELPVNAGGKVMKAELRRRLAAPATASGPKRSPGGADLSTS